MCAKLPAPAFQFLSSSRPLNATHTNVCMMMTTYRWASNQPLRDTVTSGAWAATVSPCEGSFGSTMKRHRKEVGGKATWTVGDIMRRTDRTFLLYLAVFVAGVIGSEALAHSPSAVSGPPPPASAFPMPAPYKGQHAEEDFSYL